MPELPEVETTLRGVKPHILSQTITNVIVRHPRLRWPIPPNLNNVLAGQVVNDVTRRGKYLLLSFKTGALILHLGMSGRIRVLSEPTPPQKHDHVDICFSNGCYLRFSDPRRFGAVLWTAEPISTHPLLAPLGVEPLAKEFNSTYLFNRSRHKKAPVKSFIMDSHVVTGVGNIYATEALFLAHIKPTKPAGSVEQSEYEQLTKAIKSVLKHAITKGGTTLKDFTQSNGKPGYFQIELNVYGKAGEPCPACGAKLKSLRLAQRGTVYCAKCQK